MENEMSNIIIHKSLISENEDGIMKLEADFIDDCVWRSNIEIPQTHENNNIFPSENQVLLAIIVSFKKPNIYIICMLKQALFFFIEYIDY